jgi:predicted amidohydrolase
MTRIALFQAKTGIDPAANADALVAAIGEAAAGGAAMLFTPEMSGLLDRDSKRAAASIVGEDEDRALRACRDTARERCMWVHLGSLAIRADDGTVANRGFVIDDRAEVRARYDKIHLFDVNVPDAAESHRESAGMVPGRGLGIIDTPVGRLGVGVCYDLRFPELFRRLIDGGAQLLVVSAAFTVPTGEAHWHLLLRARAVENLCHLVAAAQVGNHENGRQTYGHSAIIDCWGRVLAELPDGEGVAVGEVDFERQARVRAEFPALEHRVIGRTII